MWYQSGIKGLTFDYKDASTPTDNVYHSGNYVDLDLDGQLDGRQATDADFLNVNATLLSGPSAFPPVPVTVDAAQDAYNTIVATVGASLVRDGVDARFVGDLTSLGVQGQIIHSQDDVGGFGQLQGGTPPASCAGDGIPDNWKIRYGLDPCVYDPNGDVDGTGYTNIEKYVNGLVDGMYP